MANTYQFNVNVVLRVRANSEEEAAEVAEKELKELMNGDTTIDYVDIDELIETDDPEILAEYNDHPSLTAWERNR